MNSEENHLQTITDCHSTFSIENMEQHVKAVLKGNEVCSIRVLLNHQLQNEKEIVA